MDKLPEVVSHAKERSELIKTKEWAKATLDLQERQSYEGPLEGHPYQECGPRIPTQAEQMCT